MTIVRLAGTLCLIYLSYFENVKKKEDEHICSLCNNGNHNPYYYAYHF